MADQTSPILHALPRLTYSMEEAAELLGVSRPQLEKILLEGNLRCLKLLKGGHRRISYASLLRYVEQRDAEGF